MMRSSRLSLFMIIVGTPVTLVLMMNYLPLANRANNEFVFFSCLLECLSTGLYAGCLVARLFSYLFRFDLGVSRNDMIGIRVISSGPILVTHPISFLLIDWKTMASLSMTMAWLIAVIDLRMNWHEFADPVTNDAATSAPQIESEVDSLE